MKYKRVEMFVWWTCNQKCTYCMEFPNMEKNWDKKVTKYDILLQLLKYKKKWYNHVTYLWWEPFIQPVFWDALKLWKKLWYKILVTTNATTLHIEREAEKYLPYIDELILSVEAIDKDSQQAISRTKVHVRWDEVFENIKKYWKGSYFKANIVITKDNLEILYDLVKYLYDKWLKDIAIVYPDIYYWYYSKEHIKQRIAPIYSDCISHILKIYDYCKENDINLKVTDIPFCVFPKDKIEDFIKITDDFDYWTRIKIMNKDKILDRKNLELYEDIPRDRFRIEKCDSCKYKWTCWWPSIHYKAIFWNYDEINPIKN